MNVLDVLDVPTPTQTHCVSSVPPSRGRHQRPGKAGSAVSLVGAALRLPERGRSSSVNS
ncbi:MAG: hypothetical protein ORN28_01100 [Rhodoferax sp.]|nr:hypothetical protein [Rhodoferax sp.]